MFTYIGNVTMTHLKNNSTFDKEITAISLLLCGYILKQQEGLMDSQRDASAGIGPHLIRTALLAKIQSQRNQGNMKQKERRKERTTAIKNGTYVRFTYLCLYNAYHCIIFTYLCILHKL